MNVELRVRAGIVGTMKGVTGNPTLKDTLEYISGPLIADQNWNVYAPSSITIPANSVIHISFRGDNGERNPLNDELSTNPLLTIQSLQVEHLRTSLASSITVFGPDTGTVWFGPCNTDAMITLEPSRGFLMYCNEDVIGWDAGGTTDGTELFIQNNDVVNDATITAIFNGST